MRTYVLMSKLAPHGPSVIEVVSSVKDGTKGRRMWIEQVKKQCPEVTFTAQKCGQNWTEQQAVGYLSTQKQPVRCAH